MEWFVNNLPSFACGAVAVLIAAVAVAKTVKAHKKGGCPGCGGKCSPDKCPMCAARQAKEKES